jgi:hypothetical protein
VRVVVRLIKSSYVTSSSLEHQLRKDKFENLISKVYTSMACD